MTIGLLLWLSATARANDCSNALDAARAADRSQSYARLRVPAARAVACDPSNLVAQALLAKAAEYEGDWEAQLTAASTGEQEAGNTPVATPFSRSRRRAETLLALDRLDLDAAADGLAVVRDGLGADAADPIWVAQREAELDALRAVSRGRSCTFDGAPFRTDRAWRSARDRANAYEMWCEATRAAATRDPDGMTAAIALSPTFPIPDASEVLRRQQAILRAQRDDRGADVQSLLDELEGFEDYPGLGSFIASVREDQSVVRVVPARPETSPESASSSRPYRGRSPAGPLLMGAGAALVVTGGVLGYLGARTVDRTVDSEGCGTASDGNVYCTTWANDDIANGELQQIAGTAVAGVGGVLAVTGLGIRIAGKTPRHEEVASAPPPTLRLEGRLRGFGLRIHW